MSVRLSLTVECRPKQVDRTSSHQEHLQLCHGTKIERRGLNLSDKKRGKGDTGLLEENENEFSVVQCIVCIIFLVGCG